MRREETEGSPHSGVCQVSIVVWSAMRAVAVWRRQKRPHRGNIASWCKVVDLSMDGGFTIGRLAAEAGIPVSSVRYYERRGLIRPDGRSGSGRYRVYGPGAVERLRFIRAAQGAGFTLRDIAALLEFRDGDLTPCEEVQGLIARRLRRVEVDIAHLERVRVVLRRWLGVCRRSASSGRCGVLAGLERPCACEQDADTEERAIRKRKKA